MNLKLEKIEKNVAKMEITVPAEKFDEAIKWSYHKNCGKFNVPGFRKGKAPQAIIERYYGESVFYEDAVNFACDETYPEAVKENNLVPVDYPELDIKQIKKGEDFIYTAKVTVKPEVTLGEYKGVESKKISYPVSDEDVDAKINEMRDKNARIKTKENGIIDNGDIAVIDFEGFIGDTAFEGGKGENYELAVGSHTFIEGFEEQLVGKKTGENVDVNVKFPDNYRSEELKGKDVLFKVTVKEVKCKELPELDDEFAKDVSEFDKLDELKKDIREKLEENNAERAKNEYEGEVIKKVTDAAKVEIPDIMIQKEVDYMVRDLDMRLKYQGLDIEKYTKMMNTTVDAVKNDFKETATDRVKTNLVLEAIAKVEKIEVTDEEIEKRAEEIAKNYGAKDTDKIKENILKSEKSIIKDELANNKVIELIVNQSKTID